MSDKNGRQPDGAEKLVRDIRRVTRRHFSAEEKIRIVLDGLRGEDSIAELCRREGTALERSLRLLLLPSAVRVQSVRPSGALLAPPRQRAQRRRLGGGSGAGDGALCRQGYPASVPSRRRVHEDRLESVMTKSDFADIVSPEISHEVSPLL